MSETGFHMFTKMVLAAFAAYNIDIPRIEPHLISDSKKPDVVWIELTPDNFLLKGEYMSIDQSEQAGKYDVFFGKYPAFNADPTFKSNPCFGQEAGLEPTANNAEMVAQYLAVYGFGVFVEPH